MKKLLLITGAILIAYLILITVAAPPAATPWVSAEVRQSEPEGYLVTEYEGRVAVYRDGVLYRTTDTLLSSLPKADVRRLREGIKVNSEKELKRLLEDYCS